MKLKKKMMALALVTCLSTGTAFVAKEKTMMDGWFWWGVGKAAAKQGATEGALDVISGIGILQSAIHGAAWGCAFGGPAGIAAGAAASVVAGV